MAAEMIHAPKCERLGLFVKTENGFTTSRCKDCGAVIMERDE
jgi:predicted RNA-binding Zn-ribbon protein involved in translation (DUF1610 family)